MPRESYRRDYGLLVGFLKSLSNRLQLRTGLEIFFLLSSGFILTLLGSLFIFKFKHLFPYLPLIYSFLTFLSLFFLVLSGAWRIFSKPSMKQMARRLEERFPQLKDDVINSLLLYNELEQGQSPGQISEGLIKAQIRKTIEGVRSIQPSQVVSFREAFGYLRLWIPLMITFFFVLVLDPPFLSRSLALLMNPLSEVPVRETIVSIEPKGSILLRGTPVEIRAKATGSIPDKLMLSIWPEGREPIRQSMEAVGNGQFTYRLASAQRSFRYQAYGRYGSSPVHMIRVVDPPRYRESETDSDSP